MHTITKEVLRVCMKKGGFLLCERGGQRNELTRLVPEFIVKKEEGSEETTKGKGEKKGGEGVLSLGGLRLRDSIGVG